MNIDSDKNIKQNTHMSKITIGKIISDYNLWKEYIDLSGVDSEEKFKGMTIGEKLDIIKVCFNIETE